MSDIRFCFRVLLLTLLWGFGSPVFAETAPVAKEGLIDLSEWRFETDGSVRLAGQYEFYWQQFLSGNDLLTATPISFADVPSPWNGTFTGADIVSGHGYATYRLNILVPVNAPRLAFRFRDIGTASRIFIDGELRLTAGHPGTRPDNNEPGYQPAVVEFTPKGQRVELVIHVANFDHRRGGVWKSIFLGSAKAISTSASRQTGVDLMLFGAILMIALFNLALFILRPDKLTNLFLSLFCLAAALRIISVNERFIIQVLPDLNWSTLTRLEYLSWYAILPLFAHFLLSLYPTEIHRRVVHVFDGITLLAFLIVITMPMAIYSYTAAFMQATHLFAVFYGAWVLLLARHHRRQGAKLLFFGYLFLLACAVNDILLSAWILDTPSLIIVGFVAFVICQTILATFDFANSVRTVEKQHEQLATTSLKLKTQEKLRQDAELESRKVSERFRESQQFEALGILTHGVMPGLKASVSEAAQSVDALTDEVKSNPETLTAINKTRDSTEKVIQVIEDLLNLSTLDKTRHATNTNRVVKQLLAQSSLTTRAEKQNVSLELQLTTGIQPVSGSPLHLERIVESLLENALDSQPAGGEVVIASEQTYTDGRMLFYDRIEPGYYVVVSVEDKGTGIAPDDLDEIFQPSFSRRHNQPGIGLGMSVIRAIIKQLGGGIDVISQTGQGTRFDIYLPVALNNG